LADSNLKVELVASEPLVQDPVAITFDEGGRLWVVEMLGFMTDIDGTGEKEKIGRISVLFDDDQDGKMDRSQIFLDSLVLPRAIAVVEGGALVAENIPLWYVEDTDGDFKADKKTLVDAEYGGQGMPEHSANGLWRGLDNWYYNAKSKYRYRKTDGEWVKEETEFRGQWGICHDDAGRLFYNYNWSQLHADLVPPGALGRNKNHNFSSGIDHGLTLDRKVFPIRSNTAINRGYIPGTLDDKGRILEFASACAPLINRGHALGDSYYGDAFVCEPTANLIKQNKIIEEGFMLSAKGAYENKEFLASTDERFRPISLASGPDGALYVVDMYKGIIQHGPYMTPYLREESLKRGLDKPIHMGRIWRVSSKKESKLAFPVLEKADSATLLGLLGHSNGWTRDMAQRLLVEKRDFSVVPELAKIVSEGSPLAQIHALWSLNGLGQTNVETYLPALKSKDPRVVQTALRLLQNLIPSHPEVGKNIEAFVKSNYDQAHPLVQMQMVLSGNLIDRATAIETVLKFLDSYGHLPVGRDVVMSSLHHRESDLLSELLASSDWKGYDQNREIFLEMLAASIAISKSKKGIGQLQNIVASTPDSSLQWINMAIANGMNNIKDDTSEDELTANASDEVKPQVFAQGRQKYLNLCANCHGTSGEGMARFAPPLKKSEWVSGDGHKLAMIILHGMEGPVTVNGKEYDIPDILPNMPAFTTLQDSDIAAIISYMRNSWGHSEPTIERSDVTRIRFRTQGKITPWTASELDSLVFDIDM
jgi:mono/diheme cytochrome c family protein